MTTPAAASNNRFGDRVYNIPDPTTKEMRQLPSFSALKKILAAPGLEVWKQKNIARAIALRPDLQILAAQDDTLHAAVRQAGDDQRAANTGTGVHRFAEDIDDDVLDWDMVPDAARPYLEHYAAAKQRHGWSTLVKELTVFNMTIGYAGTPDRVNVMDGCVAVWDIKTGKSVWPDVAMQLAAYANAEGIWTPAGDMPATTAAQRQLDVDIRTGENVPKGRRKWSEKAIAQAQAAINEIYWAELAELGGHRPMPEGISLDVGYVIHATAEKCDIIPIDLRGAFDAVISLTWLHKYQSNTAGIVGKPIGATNDADSPVPAADAVVPAADAGPLPAIDGAHAVDENAGRVDTPARVGASSGEKPKRRVTHGNRITEALPEFGAEPYREWLVDRLKAWKPPSRAMLAERWPEGAPTFKASLAHTVEQLDLIREQMDAIGAELQMMDEPYSSDYWREVGPASERGGPQVEAEGLDRLTAIGTEIATDAHKAPGIATFSRLLEVDGAQTQIVDAMQAAGVHKNLRKAEWTLSEWSALVVILADVETKTTNNKEPAHAV